MSSALGAAFLTHQVEQLEKSVSAAPPRPSPSRNHNSNSNNNNNNNWRDRQRSHPQQSADSKRGQLPIGGIRITTTHAYQQHQQQQRERPGATKTRGAEDAKKTSAKEADVIVVDASVLVNALGQVKKWCRDGQEEIIIVPLEGTVSFSPTLSCLFLSSTRDHACPAPLADLAPALRRQRYVTPPDSPGEGTLASRAGKLEFVPSYQPAGWPRSVWSAIHS